MEKFLNFLKDEEGATAVEYGLIVALIAAAIILAVSTLGGKLVDTFGAITTAITSVVP